MSHRFRVVFMGCPEFAVPSLKALQQDDNFDVVAVYCMPDRPKGRGKKAAMTPVKSCALKYGIAGKKQRFMAFDGIHEAEVENDGLVCLQMADVNESGTIDGNYSINTGSPHYIVFSEDIDRINVNEEGKALRWSPKFAPGGTNVNFVQVVDNGLYIRTFERGVEEETLACGTGVTASAIASVLAGHFDRPRVKVRTKGGNLEVEFKIKDKKVTDIWLKGPATFVFEGKINI